MRTNQKCLVIAGPTASGKSALAVRVAERLAANGSGGVVINADSMQVYRDLPLLTAQPDAATRARAPHALFGALDAAEICSAARWRDLARAEIRAAHAAGRLPIVTGGTGLYLRALMEGIADLPEIPAEIRDRVRRRMAKEGPQALLGELARHDPKSARRLAPTDRQRIARALEVWAATGRPLSAFHAEAAHAETEFDFYVVLLMPPKPALDAAIATRLGTMLERGALDEVRTLLARRLDPRLPAMKALGVCEFGRALGGEIGLEEALHLAEIASRQYAKRQATWFRHQVVSRANPPGSGPKAAAECGSPRLTVVNAQFSERLEHEFFTIIRHFPLTPEGPSV